MSDNFEEVKDDVIEGDYKDVTDKKNSDYDYDPARNAGTADNKADTVNKKTEAEKKKAEKAAKKAEKKAEKKAKKSGGGFKKFLAVLCLAIIFGLVASFVFNVTNMAIDKINEKSRGETHKEIEPEIGFDKDYSGKPIREWADDADDFDGKPSDIEMVENAAEGNKPGFEGQMNVVQVVEEAMPSIVAITNKSVQEIRSFYGMGIKQYESTAAGSGIIIGQNDTELLIVTNAHVVEGAKTLTVCFIDEEAYEAETKGTDTTNDLAIIAVKLSDISGSTLDSIKMSKIGNSDELKIGEQVVAIGNALGYGQSVTTGIVSALNRAIVDSGSDAAYIQTDAAINPGNSGGALLNMKGELIGINSAKLADQRIEGMGYAIPINSATPILEDLMTLVTRSRVDAKDAGYLGISGFSVTDEVAELYNIPKGVYISETTAGGAAEKAGMQQGDVIVKFDGMNIDSINKLKERLEYYKAGETVDFVIARANNGEYEEQTLNVVLDARSNAPAGAFDDDGSTGNGAPQGGTPSEEMPDSEEYGGLTIPGDLFKFFGW